MSAPLAKNQMAFELPKLSYVDTRWEEPTVATPAAPVPERGLWARFLAWRAETRALAELNNMSDRELYDVGLNRGDFDRVFDNRLNGDLRARGR